MLMWWLFYPAVLLLTLVVGTAHAGPLLDAIRERRAGHSNEGKQGEQEQELEGRAGRQQGKVPLPPGSRLVRDEAYGSDPQQQLDVYIPAGANKAPIIVMVHGGAWMVGDKTYLPVVKEKVARWLPKGYILVSPNYRMSRSPRVLDEADDVAKALAYVQAHAPTWGGDAARILLMGHSAGAHLSGLVASAPSIVERHGVKPWLGTVMLDSATMNVVQTMEGKHYDFHDKVFGTDRSYWVEVSPFHRLNSKPAPMLLVCSTKRSESCPQAEAFASKVRSLGGAAQVLGQDLKHGDINSYLGKPGEYTDKVELFMHGLGLP